MIKEHKFFENPTFDFPEGADPKCLLEEVVADLDLWLGLGQLRLCGTARRRHVVSIFCVPITFFSKKKNQFKADFCQILKKKIFFGNLKQFEDEILIMKKITATSSEIWI